MSRLYNIQGTQSSNVEVAHVLGLIMKLEEKTCENCESDAIEDGCSFMWIGCILL